MRPAGERQRTCRTRTLVVMNELRPRIADHALACSPDSGTKIDVFHVEKIALIHAIEFLVEVAAYDKSSSHDPVGVERLFTDPGVAHQVPVDTALHHLSGLLYPACEHIHERIEAPC